VKCRHCSGPLWSTYFTINHDICERVTLTSAGKAKMTP